VAAVLWTIAPTYRPTIVLLAIILPGSELLVGTIFVSDIIAGLTIGVLTSMVISELFGLADRRKR